MNGNQFQYVKIISNSGQQYEFKDIQDFQINIKSKMLMVQPGDGEFCFFLDHLRYSEVGLTTQTAKPNFRQLEIVLVPLFPDQEPEILHVPDIINYDWKADSGVLMVFGKTLTMVFHIDQVISFSLNRSPE